MPYVVIDEGRYIGEHDCGNYHYGDPTLIRECCVADYLHWRETVERVAMSSGHPFILMQNAAWRSLTDAERESVPTPWMVRDRDGALVARIRVKSVH